MKTLYRLVYTSSRRAKCSDAEIANILASCKRNNPGRNITGILLHSDKRFLQYLEGDKDELLQLYDRIAADERHGGATVRDFAPIAERLFGGWHKGYKDVSSQAPGFNTAISEKDKEIFQTIMAGENFNEVHGIRVMKIFFELA